MSKEEKIAFISTISCLLFLIIGWITQINGLSIYPYLFGLAIIFGGFKQTFEGLQELIFEKKLNVDLLMTLAAIGACLLGDWLEGALLTFIFCLSGALEEYTTNKSTKEISALMALQPKQAYKLLANGTTKLVDVSELAIDDLVLVPKGATVPIDGLIVKGTTSLNEATINGESLPVEKGQDDEVYGGTTNLEQAVTIRVTKTDSETVFAKIIQLVEQAQNTPTKTATFIEKIEDSYVKIILICVPLMMIIPHFLFDWSWQTSFYRGMVLLVVASPCALVASATPAMLAAISNAARNGILLKNGQTLERFAKLKAIAFDKTGTLTNGTPVVTDTLFFHDQTEAINMLVALELQASHPIAKAICDHFQSESEKVQQIEVTEITGFGLQTTVKGETWKVGKSAFSSLEDSLSTTIQQQINDFQESGKTVIYLTKEDELQAIVCLIDTAREQAEDVIHYFKQVNVHTSMITGDHNETAKAIAEQTDVEQYFADCLPADKTDIIHQEKEQYQINAMVGDGINDAPALASAAIGIAMGKGTDIAMEVADLVLTKDDLTKLPMCHQLAKKYQRIVKQNIIFSVSVIGLLILANFTKMINLPIGVVGHEGSTILVILNGLRLLRTIPTKIN